MSLIIVIWIKSYGRGTVVVDSPHPKWGKRAGTGPGEPSCSGKRWVRWSGLRTWWPYSAGPCLWPPGPAETDGERAWDRHVVAPKQTAVVRRHLSRRSASTGDASRALKWEMKEPRPACIIGEWLPGRGAGEKVILQSRAFGSRVKFIALAGAKRRWQPASVGGHTGRRGWPHADMLICQ